MIGAAVRHRCPGSSFARRRQSSECQKEAPMLCERPLQCPRNAPGLHSNLHSTCADRALVVRFEDFTAPYKPVNQQGKDWIPASAGIQLLSESGPNSAQTDAQEHPECTGVAYKLALNMHSSCTRGAFRRLYDTPQDTQPSDRTSSFPPLRESSCCRKPAPIGCRRRLWSILLHRSCMQTCIQHALVVHSRCVSKAPRHSI